MRIERRGEERCKPVALLYNASCTENNIFRKIITRGLVGCEDASMLTQCFFDGSIHLAEAMRRCDPQWRKVGTVGPSSLSQIQLWV